MRVILLLVSMGILLAACGPAATITPVQAEERISSMPYQAAYSEVMAAITSQPYPSNSSGWVIMRSDQVGGFISAELRGSSYNFFTGATDYYAVVSVALVDQGGRTQVSISLNSHAEAEKLADEITRRLGI